MASTITISLTSQDASDLKTNNWSPTDIFRSAMRLQRARDEFFDVFDIWDFKIKLSELQGKIQFLQKEVERRQERIDSLQDVLAKEELAERRLRKVEQTNNGYPSTVREAEREGVYFGEQFAQP